MDEFLEKYKILNNYINDEVEKRSKLNPKERYQSESIDELAKALSSAQGEYPCIPFNRCTASWSDEYSDLDIIMKYIRPLLSKNEIMFSQWTQMTSDNETILYTAITHGSGQWKQSRIKICPTENDMKSFDSMMANYKRQQAISLLGVTMEGDPKDDDGVIEAGVDYKKIVRESKVAYARTKESYDCITKEQLDELECELDGQEEIATDLLNKYKLRTMADLPRSKFAATIRKVRDFKYALREAKRIK